MADMDGKEAPSSRTDRVNGEIHYKNGYTQRLYSDAHYVKEEDDTVPPRYYTPPEKPQKEPREAKPVKLYSHGVKLVCLCLLCAIMGGIAGAGIMSRRLDAQIADLSSRLDGMAERAEGAVADASGEIPLETVYPAGIYASALGNVVSVGVIGRDGRIGSVSGSGFVISDEGYILTNRHVIAAAEDSGEDIGVLFSDGELLMAELTGSEDDNDLAVLKVYRPGLVPVKMTDSDGISVGDPVYAVGSSLGHPGLSLSSGRISAPSRFVETDTDGHEVNMFQFDAPVNSGNSGCPLFSDRGQVIGVVTAKYTSAGVEGVAFAIPINDAYSIANELISIDRGLGRVRLGAAIDSGYSDMYSRYYGTPMGAYVRSVEPDSPAASAGLRAGDIITRLGETEISDSSGLTNALRLCSSGDTVTVMYYRDGQDCTAQLRF